ncbi:MAG: hypothetical protein P8X55_08180 [Desulfosarcinaceae bacterium]
MKSFRTNDRSIRLKISADALKGASVLTRELDADTRIQYRGETIYLLRPDQNKKEPEKDFWSLRSRI